MGVDQFLLTWNNHRSNFPEVFSQLRFQDQLVDVTLLCDGGSYPAHRLVLAACSPYFHNLFTHLPTQHPLVYLKDVRQAELEALLEFIYRGEVSVANSELSGLIKIAESLRIKGLGDVSQRDATSNHSQSHKRPSSPPGKPVKVPRFQSTEMKPEMDLTSLLTAAQNYQNLDMPSFGKIDPLQPDTSEHTDALRESKLRSCLEGQDVQPGPSYPPLLTGPPKIFSELLKKEEQKPTPCKKVRKERNQTDSGSEVEIPEMLPVSGDVKNDSHMLNLDDNSNQTSNEENLLLPNLRKLYESSDIGGNNFLAKYTQLLSSLQQQVQPTEEESNVGYPSLMPTSMIDPHVSPPPKDPKSLTCNLCGATIKHIANFRRHMKQHLNPRRFPCPWCNAAFGRKDNLKTHTRKHHPAEVEAEEQSSVMGNASSDAGTAEEPNATESFNGVTKPSDSPQSSNTPKTEDAADDGLVIAEEDDGDDEEVEELDSHQ